MFSLCLAEQSEHFSPAVDNGGRPLLDDDVRVEGVWGLVLQHLGQVIGHCHPLCHGRVRLVGVHDGDDGHGDPQVQPWPHGRGRAFSSSGGTAGGVHTAELFN